MRSDILRGAVHGVRAWAAYAIGECWFASILPWMVTPSSTYTPLNWEFTAILFLAYPVIGLAVGILSGLGVRAVAGRLSVGAVAADRLVRALATFSVVFAFTVNLCLAYQLGLSEVAPLGAAFLVTVALVMSASSDAWSRQLRCVTHPLAIVLILLGLPWITALLISSSIAAKALAHMGYLGALCVLSVGFHAAADGLRSWRGRAGGLAPSKPSLGHLAILAAAVLGLAAVLDQAPLRTPVASPVPPATGSPNVILITMDTVRADHLSLYGYERGTTPNLQTIARTATLYRHAIASSDMTLATHASIFTGLYARQHGAHYVIPEYLFGRPLDLKFTTLAEILSAKGYLTMAVVSNHGYLGQAYNLHQGFQYYDQRVPVPFLGPTARFYLRQGIRSLLLPFVTRRDFELTNRNAEEINREALFLLDGVRGRRQSFFLFLNYMDAHWPFLPPPPFDTLYPGKDEPFPWARYYAMKTEVMRLQRPATERERNHLISQYDGGIAYLDSQLGTLIDQLKELGLYDDSLLIIISDHGEVFAARNLIGHGVSVYQDQVDVPLLIKYPHQQEGRVVDAPVSMIDLLPTILDVLGDEAPEHLPGHSLLKLREGSTRALVSETFPDGYLYDLHVRFRRVERAVFAWPFKFISSTSGKAELYDLSADPLETHDLWGTGNPMAEVLETETRDWLASVPEFRESGKDGKAAVGDDTRERLRSLGYAR